MSMTRPANNSTDSKSCENENQIRTDYRYYYLVSDPIMLLGLIGNLALICATFRKSSKLKKKSNRLVAVLAIFDSSVCLNSLINTFFIDQLICAPMDQCFKLFLFSVFGISASAFMIALVGLDRLLAMMMPFRYRDWDYGTYLACMTCPAVLMGVLSLLLAWLYHEPSMIMDYCMPPSLFNGISLQIWIQAHVFCCLIVIVIYAVAGRKIRSLSEHKQHMFTTLCIAMAIYIGSWFATMLVAAISEASHLPESTKKRIMLFIGLNTNINVSCNGWIYALRSKVYREEILRLIDCKRKPQSTKVIEIQLKQISNGNTSKKDQNEMTAEPNARAK